jgi:type II secretory pathway component PulF
MLFSAQLSPASLVEMCHILRHSLGAGLTLRDTFRQLATRAPGRVRDVSERIRQRLERGDSLEDALKGEEKVLPPLFRAMAQVGERTGHLPEVFTELERYYLQQQKLRREFRSRTLPTLIQLVFAFLIITAVLFILGMIAGMRGGETPAVFGVRGSGAGVLFLVLSFGSLALVFVAYLVIKRAMRQNEKLDRLLLRVPALGPCVQALALGRFALALRLTLDSDLPVGKAVRFSLQATGNAAFAARTEAVLAGIKEGEDLTLALGRAQIFPAEFLSMVAIAEEGGRVPEMMSHQADYYHEEANRRMRRLVRVASSVVWLAYAAFMIIAIFQLYGFYFGRLP